MVCASNYNVLRDYDLIPIYSPILDLRMLFDMKLCVKKDRLGD
jgi:hypothetical protein